MAKVTAFLGLGIMGGSMAANMARAGFDVRGWNRTSDKSTVVLAKEAGVKVQPSAAEAVAGADAVFLCLTDVADIQEMLLGQSGIADAIKRGALVVDMSTTGPQCAQELYSELGKKGLRFLDAPVSGGDVGARDGTLTIMVGGDKDAFDECMPWFQAMGKNIWHCGGAGSGQAVKLCNQVLCAVNMIAVCEAFDLARSLEINPELVVQVCSTGAAGSWALSNLGPRILRGDFKPGFKIKDMQKDLRLVCESLAEFENQLPGTALAEQKFAVARDAVSPAGGDQGTQAMMRAYKQNE